MTRIEKLTIEIRALERSIEESRERLQRLQCEVRKEVMGILHAHVPLTPRQKQILAMKSLGNKQIAAELNITIRTVKFHISSLLREFQVQSRADLP